MAVDYRQIEQFIYREARLADENAYDEWLAMWADDALYWVPANIDDPDPSKHISTIYDNRKHLEQRIKRLKSGMAHAQAPVSRMRRVISNVEIAEHPDGIVEAQSNFILGELRRGHQDVFIGRAIHRLRPDGAGGYRIAEKKVLLLNNDGFIDNLTFLI